MTFDMDAADRSDLPELGETVHVTIAPSRLGGDKITKLSRIRAPRPSLDEALSTDVAIPVGRDDTMVPLRHVTVGSLSLCKGLGVGDLLGGDVVTPLTAPMQATATATVIFQEGDLAFLRLDVLPFMAGRTWGRGRALDSDSASICFFPMWEDDSPNWRRLAEIEAAASTGTEHAIFVPVGDGHVLWVRADAPAHVREATDAQGHLATILLDLNICATKRPGPAPRAIRQP